MDLDRVNLENDVREGNASIDLSDSANDDTIQHNLRKQAQIRKEMFDCQKKAQEERKNNERLNRVNSQASAVTRIRGGTNLNTSHGTQSNMLTENRLYTSDEYSEESETDSDMSSGSNESGSSSMFEYELDS